MRLVSVLLLLILGCRAAPDSESTLERHRFEHAAMGTRWSVVLYAQDADQAERAARAAFEVVDSIDRVASDYDPGSELARLVGRTTAPKSASETQAAYEARVRESEVSPLLLELLVEARHYAATTDGAFDPTLGALTRLWRRARRQAEVPTPERLASAVTTAGYEQLFIDAARGVVRLERDGMRLDLGAIAKGQALDRALAAMNAAGVQRALIEGGGDLRAGAAPPGAEHWVVALEGSELRVGLVDAGMATSGDAYRGFELDGVRYSHLIARDLGRAVTGERTATVIAPTAAEADAFASAACVVGESGAAAWFTEESGRSACLGAAGGPTAWRSPGWSAHEIPDSALQGP